MPDKYEIACACLKFLKFLIYTGLDFSASFEVIHMYKSTGVEQQANSWRYNWSAV